MVTRNRRQTSWFDHISPIKTLASGATESLDLSDAMTESDKRGATVTRILLTIYVRPVLVDLSQRWFYGITMMSRDSVVAGALPDPEVASDQPGWMLRDFRAVLTHDAEHAQAIQHMTYDLRAQRRFTGPSNELEFVSKNLAGGGTSVEYAILSRVLCRLS